MRNLMMTGGLLAVMLTGQAMAADIGEPATQTSTFEPIPVATTPVSEPSAPSAPVAPYAPSMAISATASALASATSTAAQIMMQNTAPVAAAAHEAMDHAGMDMGAMEMPAVAGDTTAPASKALAEANAKMHAGMSVPMIGDADVDFVRGMVAHHQGAIDMAKVELAYGKDPDMKMLANDIIKAQAKEIEQMNSWLALHGPKDMGTTAAAPAAKVGTPTKPKAPVIKASAKAKPIGELLKDSTPVVAAAVTPTVVLDKAVTKVTAVAVAVKTVTPSAVVDSAVTKVTAVVASATTTVETKLIPDDENMDMPLLDGMGTMESTGTGTGTK